MAEKSEADLVKLAFELLAERGWERFSFAELARRAELPLAQVYAEVPDRAGPAAPARSAARRGDARHRHGRARRDEPRASGCSS